jgi:integrase
VPKLSTPLTDREIKTAKPNPNKKVTKLSDGGGLVLLVKQMTNSISKQWKYNYLFNGKQKTYSIGTYPTISLSQARDKHKELRNLVANGIDPQEQKKEAKLKVEEQKAKIENTFKKIALEWHTSYQSEVTENYHHKLLRMLEIHIFPIFGNIPIDEIEALQIIKKLESIKQQEGKEETARRVYNLINKIFKYAVTYKYLQFNPASGIDTRIVLGKKKVKHYPEIKDPKTVLASIDDYIGDWFTCKALQLLPYIFVRAENIRLLEWYQIDFEKKQIYYEASQMKIKKEFILPLSTQAMKILQEVYENRISEKYVFNSPLYKDRGLSENTFRNAFRRMGYSNDDIVPHSFRSLFSTICYENQQDHGIAGEVIEALLHHQEKNSVKQAYNRAQYLEPKKELIQWYADYIDENYREL